MREGYTLTPKRQFTGSGWLPKGATHPNLNAGRSGLMLAHDLLEHQNGAAALGTVIDEMEAFGAIWAIRGQHSVLFDGEQCPSNRVVEYYVDNFRYLMKQYLKNVDELPNLTVLVERPWLDGTIREAFKSLEHSEWYDPDYVEAHRVEWFIHCARYYMHQGYAKAIARFGSAKEAASLFWSLSYELDTLIKTEEPYGCELHVIIEDYVPRVYRGKFVLPKPKPEGITYGSFFNPDKSYKGFQHGS